jgi:hypothetical protein
MPKDSSMQHTSHITLPAREAFRQPITPWALRAWPPILWQAGHAGVLQLHHLGTHVALGGDDEIGLTGQTMWGGNTDGGNTGVAWDWIQISHGVVAMADPLSVITNLRLIGDEGEVLTSWQAARFLNLIVHALPWQDEVTRALNKPH